MPSTKYIIDHGGSVNYLGYELHTTRMNGRQIYYAKSNRNDYDAVGPYRTVSDVMKAIKRETTTVDPLVGMAFGL